MSNLRKKPQRSYNWKALVRSKVRQVWMWSPMRREAIRAARIKPRTLKCQSLIPVPSCLIEMREDSKPKLYQVDHIQPASEPSVLIHDWNDFLKRLFIESSKLRVLCVNCHEAKTKKENEKRKKRT